MMTFVKEKHNKMLVKIQSEDEDLVNQSSQHSTSSWRGSCINCSQMPEYIKSILRKKPRCENRIFAMEMRSSSSKVATGPRVRFYEALKSLRSYRRRTNRSAFQS